MIALRAPEIHGPTYLKTGGRWYFVRQVEAITTGRSLKDDGTSWLYKAACVDTRGAEVSLTLHNDGSSYETQADQPPAFRKAGLTDLSDVGPVQAKLDELITAVSKQHDVELECGDPKVAGAYAIVLNLLSREWLAAQNSRS